MKDYNPLCFELKGFGVRHLVYCLFSNDEFLYSIHDTNNLKFEPKLQVQISDPYVTLNQTTQKSRLDQTETICRRQFQI